MGNSGEQAEQHELQQDYIQTFEELQALGAVGFDGGETVTFQPWGSIWRWTTNR